MPDEVRKKVEEEWEKFAAQWGMNPGTKTYMKFQKFFFVGAMKMYSAMTKNDTPDASWSMSLLSNRDIIRR